MAEIGPEVVRLPAPWLRSEAVPYDEIVAWDGALARLRDGSQRRVPAAERAALERALAVPSPTGRAGVDGPALLAYTAGAWSPLRAAEALLAMAEAARASDLHVEAEGDAHTLRLRREGELEPLCRLPAPTGRRLLAALKHLAGCMPYRADLVQEGRVRREGVAADVRASFVPTALGERAALRLYGRLLHLDALGLPGEALAGLRAALAHRSGLLLVAGPSGGGKTTTVYAALAELVRVRGGAHLSIEDPVEQRLRKAGIPVDQVELDPARGLTAEAALAAALRQDVDVVALAELRHPAEAALALRAAHTGRLVLAGLHAGSPAQARQRMLDLGAEPAVLDATLRAVLHQHLRRVPCPDHAGESCATCGGSGAVRRPVAALWRPPEDPCGEGPPSSS